MIETPQLAHPFRIEDGAVAEVEQGSSDDIAACVEILLRHPMGWLPEAPEFGRPRGLNFAKGDVDLERIAEQIARFEPRASFLLEEDPDALRAAVRRVSIQMQGGAQ